MLPENHFLSKRSTIIGILLVLAGIALFYNLGENSLRAEEPRRATISMEMIFSGNYMHPTLNGWSYYNKPPLFNWAQVVFMKAFNSNEEWVARLPSLLSHILCSLLVYFGFKNYVGKKTASLTAILSLLAVELLFYGSVFSGEIDLFFSLLVFLQIMSLFIFYHRKQWLSMFFASYFFCALGILTKGPPSIAFQGLTLIGMAVLYKDIRLMFRWQHFAAGIFCLIISGGYFYLYNFDGDAVAYMVRLFKEASQRTGLETELSKTLIGIVSVPFKILLLIAPATILLPYSLKKGNWQMVKSNKLLSFALYFVLFNLPLYWFTGDFKNRYIYMFFPFMIVFFAFFYENRKSIMPKLNNVMVKIWNALLFLFLISPIVFYFLPFSELVSNINLKTAALFSLFAGVIVLFHKTQKHRFLIFLIAATVLRIGYDAYYPEILAAKTNQRIEEEINTILDLAEGRKIQFVGYPFIQTSDASVGPLKISEVTTTIAPSMSYQIPYYYAKNRDEIFEFSTEIRSGKLYMAYKSFFLLQNKKELYRFTDTFKNTIVLFEG